MAFSFIRIKKSFSFWLDRGRFSNATFQTWNFNSPVQLTARILDLRRVHFDFRFETLLRIFLKIHLGATVYRPVCGHISMIMMVSKSKIVFTLAVKTMELQGFIIAKNWRTMEISGMVWKYLLDHLLHQILHILENTTPIFFQTTFRDDIPDQSKINTCCDKIKLTNEIICEFRAMTSSVQLSPEESRIPNSYDFPFYECNQPNLYIFHVDYSGLGIWIISGRFQFLGSLLVQFERIHQCRWRIRVFLSLTSPFFKYSVTKFRWPTSP